MCYMFVCLSYSICAAIGVFHPASAVGSAMAKEKQDQNGQKCKGTMANGKAKMAKGEQKKSNGKGAMINSLGKKMKGNAKMVKGEGHMRKGNGPKTVKGKGNVIKGPWSQVYKKTPNGGKTKAPGKTATG